MSWQVITTDTAFSNLKQIEKENKAAFFGIKFAINKLESNPLKIGKALLHEFGNYRWIKDSDFKIVYWIDNDKKIVVVTAILHKETK